MIELARNNSAPAAPLWSPSPQRVKSTQLYAFMKAINPSFEDYHTLWGWSVENIEECWSRVWDFCDVIGEKGDRILQDADKMPGAKFFPQAKLNYAENLLRRRDGGTAIIFRDEMGNERTLTYRDLYEQVSLWQQVFRDSGVGVGDRVAAYMPNIPETLIACLAASSLGAIFSSASPDFGVQGVLDRFAQIEPKVFVSVDGYYYNGKVLDIRANIEEIIPQLPGLAKTILVPFVGTGTVKGTYISSGLMGMYAPKDVTFERLSFDHPLFIMFSSGTTGKPKCIVHGQGGTLLQHVKEHRLHCDVKRDDRVFYFTTCGWMMWNWLISALACEATVMLYDGSPFYPDGRMLWAYTSKHKCMLFGTSAKFIDALRVNDIHPAKEFDLSDLKIITSTGSPLVHEGFDFVYASIKNDVHLASIYGGTDIISAAFGLGNPISPVWRGELQGPGLGSYVDIYDEHGKPVPEGAGAGDLVCLKPIPSMPVGFWGDEDGSRFRAAYFEGFPGVWQHGDWVEKTIHHGLIVHGRSDATLNPGGVRIGTAEIYRQVEQVEGIAESIAVGQDWEGDVRVILFVVLKQGFGLNEDMQKTIRTKIRTGASPRHVPAKIIQVGDIPRTKSGKITELAVRDVIHGRPVKNKEALANPDALLLYEKLSELDN